jgi:hypothetical protein
VPHNYFATGGESLCEVAVYNGFADCQKVRNASEGARDIVTLAPGQCVYIPDKDENLFEKFLEFLHLFQRPNFPPPKVTFIREDGYGFANPPAPDKDPQLSTLAFTNYVSDRGNNGFDKNTFPGYADFLAHINGSADPDHFKVQVYDSNIDGDSVTVDLVPMRPDYYAQKARDATFVALHPTKFTPDDARKLTVTCQRVPGTKYFRSPYLRLVSSQGSQARRPQQCLLIAGFFNDGGPAYLRRYGELLHHKVRATYKLPKCPAGKCASVALADIESSRSLHMALWIIAGSAIDIDALRERIYTTIRATLAPTNVRPIIESIKIVDPPRNLLAVANSLPDPSRGRHASGTNGKAQSTMKFSVDGVPLSISPARGDSPGQTADKLIAAIAKNPKLAGYSTQKLSVKLPNPVASTAANPNSPPADVLVFKPDKTPALVDKVSSDDSPDPKGNYGQSLVAANTKGLVTTLGGARYVRAIPIGWPGAAAEQRALRYAFNTPNCINMYVCGDILYNELNNNLYDGWSPYGNFLNAFSDVGPCVYLGDNGVRRPYVVFHEIGHPLMHSGHAKMPFKDAFIIEKGYPTNPTGGSVTVELMDASVDSTDTFDSTFHVADTPISAWYELVEEGAAMTLIDGQSPTPTSKTKWTPVSRFHTVGAAYGIIRQNVLPRLDPDITDLPAGP